MPLARVQSPSVRKVIGEDAEQPTGKLVEKGQFGTVLRISRTVNIGGTASPSADVVSRQDSDASMIKCGRKAANGSPCELRRPLGCRLREGSQQIAVTPLPTARRQTTLPHQGCRQANVGPTCVLYSRKTGESSWRRLDCRRPLVIEPKR